jgi:hypothetical protein
VAKLDSIGLVMRRCPVLGGVVVERQQHVEVVGDLGDQARAQHFHDQRRLENHRLPLSY